MFKPVKPQVVVSYLFVCRLNGAVIFLFIPT